MKAIIYARVSRSDQSTQRQIQELTRVEGYEIVRIFEEKISGYSKASSERPELQKAIKYLKENRTIDALLISEISRLGRNTKDVLTLIEEFEKEEITLYVHNIGKSIGEYGDLGHSISKLIITIMADLARLESDQTSHRIKSGIQARKQRGLATGRKVGSKETPDKFMKKHQDIVKYLKQGFSYRQIQKLCDCGPGTISKVKSIIKQNELTKT